jgi:hypothetical protein
MNKLLPVMGGSTVAEKAHYMHIESSPVHR